NRFSPSELQIEDVSAGGCGTFFAITITSEAFKGLPMVKQHKLVTQTLKDEIEEIHGLQVRSTTLESIFHFNVLADKNKILINSPYFIAWKETLRKHSRG
ncbi:bola protein, partial [Mycena vulgaris]